MSAVECYDEAKVKTVTRAAIGADGTKTFDQRYPAAGTPNVAVSLTVMSADGSHRQKVDLGADPDIYVARVDWSKDGRTLYVQRQSRDQKTLDLLAVDPATGASRTLFSETSKTWVNLTDDFRPLADGSLIWGSERSGYMHLYRYADGVWTQLTHGDWTVEMNGQSHATGVIGVDEAQHRLFFAANKDDVLESQIYTIDYLHPGEPQRITERGYWNDALMDKAATHLLVTRSSPSQPSQVYLADATGRRVSWIEENRLDAAHPYAPYLAAHRPVTYGTIKAADGSDLHYEMITPKLVPGKHYPVFFEHYGGPGSQQVKRSWMGAAAAILGVEGLDLCPDRQSRLGQSRHRLRQPDLSCDGQRRGRRPGDRRVLAAEPEIRRSEEDRDLRLVLRRLYDAQDARDRTPGPLCGGGVGRAGDSLGTSTTRIIPNAISAIRRPCLASMRDRTRSRRRRRSRRRCC